MNPTLNNIFYLYSLKDEPDKSNGRGFNRIDAGILSSMCRYYIEHNRLSIKQMEVLERRLKKYHKQLSTIGDFDMNAYIEKQKQKCLFIEDDC